VSAARALAVSGLLLVAAGAQAGPARRAPVALSAAAVLKQIAAEGADRALEKLYGADRTWAAVLGGVRSGSRPWLEVAEKLKTAGAPSNPELIGAVAQALETAPANVLRVLGHEHAFDANNVCSMDTFEDLLGASYDVALRHVKARQRAVAAVRDPALAAARAECLDFLHELETNITLNKADWFSNPWDTRP
jgi:hypothetical protein